MSASGQRSSADWGRLRAVWASVLLRFWEADRAGARTTWRRLPVAALVVATALVVVAAFTRPFLGQLPPEVLRDWAWSVEQTLAGEVWRTATATLLTRDIFMLSSLVVTTALLLAVLERLAGRWIALATWAIGAVWGFLGTSLLVAGLATTGWDVAERAVTTVDLGPSSGAAAVAAAVIWRMRHRAVTVVLTAALLIGSALHHQIADVEHLVSFFTLLLAVVAWRTVRPRPVQAAREPTSA